MRLGFLLDCVYCLFICLCSCSVRTKWIRSSFFCAENQPSLLPLVDFCPYWRNAVMIMWHLSFNICGMSVHAERKPCAHAKRYACCSLCSATSLLDVAVSMSVFFLCTKLECLQLSTCTFVCLILHRHILTAIFLVTDLKAFLFVCVHSCV